MLPLRSTGNRCRLGPRRGQYVGQQRIGSKLQVQSKTQNPDTPRMGATAIVVQIYLDDDSGPRQSGRADRSKHADTARTSRPVNIRAASIRCAHVTEPAGAPVQVNAGQLASSDVRRAATAIQPVGRTFLSVSRRDGQECPSYVG